MPIDVTCQGCGARYLAHDERAGGSYQCTRCQALIKIPKPAGASNPWTGGELAFRNPANGYIEVVAPNVWIWVLLGGAIYFAMRGVWTHAAAGLLLAPLTLGVSWLVYPVFARRVLETHYLRQGWHRVGS